MKGLSTPTDPRIARRIKIQLIIAAMVGASLAYGALCLAAVIAREVLK